MANITATRHATGWRALLAWVVEPVKKWIADKCPTMSAAIAFFAAFSLAPTLVMVIAVASFFFGADAVKGRLFGQIRGFMGDEAAAGIQAIVANAQHSHNATGSAILSLVALAIGASATFSTLNTALNVVWPVQPADMRASVVGLLKVRLISFGLVLGIAFLLVVTLVVNSAIQIAGTWLWGEASDTFLWANIVQLVVTLLILSLAFAALLKFLPDAHVAWKDSVRGGIAAALLFTGGKHLFALYLAHAGMANSFGAAGSLAVILMWLFYSAAVLLLGAEFAAISAMKRGAAPASVPVPGKKQPAGTAHPDKVTSAHPEVEKPAPHGS